MNKDHLKKKLSGLALSMFRKDFFGIYHGSISAKTESNRFVINTKEAIFDALDESSLIELYYKKDYRWNQASIDSNIHHSIYSQISDAKFICFSMPPFTTAYSLDHNIITPKDYFGYKELGSIEIVDPRSFDDWYERASSEIAYYFQSKKTDIMVIRGYGVYTFNRDVHEMAKKIAILEKSCRLLLLDNTKNDSAFD
ncbi:class II aldolase and adducin N-terminal domain-containing protein [Sulfurimonas sp.]|uniref:class II aldolase and adducin N-terminal domain-containing protein n=1 Tax=Sulfurimonas sp. TaxID=2022749 RepID=UPI0019E00850|nr:class II aldolase and adducin N-terminal domain-containing protein [Sulfurimonas sp.]MBE0513388.1 class II aldolase/adducin family protein [Sulfurimonas sp.]MDT8338509.1 class II aldolase and adducin N-terminal domain-containing protein [Sulfurimonas sp.]